MSADELLSIVGEQWRPVVGYEGHYEVSDLGGVRGLERILVTKVGQVRRQQGTVLSPGRTPKGRLAVHLRVGGGDETRLVHHLVLEAFVGPRPAGLVACHNDGNCTNNALTNLRWDTPSANMLDAVRHGTHASTRKTHCPRGHLLDHPNLHPSRLRIGYRQCWACYRARANARKAKRAGRPYDFESSADAQYQRLMGGAA